MTYHRCTTLHTVDDEEIPYLEEEEEEEEEHQDDSPHSDNLLTHHNTHQESECICQEYLAQLPNLDDNQYYHQIDQAQELQYSIPVTPYDWPTSHNPPQNPPRALLRSTDELQQLLSKGHGKARCEELHSHRSMHTFSTKVYSEKNQEEPAPMSEIYRQLLTCHIPLSSITM